MEVGCHQLSLKYEKYKLINTPVIAKKVNCMNLNSVTNLYLKKDGELRRVQAHSQINY